MYIKAQTVDDLLHKVFTRLLAKKSEGRIRPTRGDASEVTGVLLQVSQPRARLSLTEQKGRIFTSLGELLWYLSGKNDLRFISYYAPKYKVESTDKKTIYGGYGPRLFSMNGSINQIENIISLLRQNPFSRRAVIQLFDAADINGKREKDIPCTCVMQFLIRNRKLDMLVTMRSSDAFIGLPHDIFSFTMLQEMISRTLDLDIGKYKHFAGSLHLYEDKHAAAVKYLNEGWQETVHMPVMPIGNPWPVVKNLLKIEEKIRKGIDVDDDKLRFDQYWLDIIRLLKIYRYSIDGNIRGISSMKKKMSTHVYDSYIDQRRKRASRVQYEATPIQGSLLGVALTDSGENFS
jgi:thymidylate synthase